MIPARPAGPGAAAPAADRGPFAGAPGDTVFESLRAAPARIDLTPGLPDLAAFPRAAWLRAERAVLAGLSPADLGYGDPRGTPALRQALAGWLARTRGIRADPGEVIITAGVSQAIGLISQPLRDAGEVAVAVEDPGSLGVRQVLRNWRLDTPPVPVDGGGLDVAALRASGAAVVMVTPARQFPTGVVLAGPRRQDLLRWASGGGLVIEDDYDAEHRYDRPPVPALRALSRQVCYTGSVSKLLAPALRLGWILPPPRYTGAVLAAKRHSDLGNAALPQLVLARLITSGDLERQVRLLRRRRHRRRRDAMTAAVRAHLPGPVSSSATPPPRLPPSPRRPPFWAISPGNPAAKTACRKCLRPVTGVVSGILRRTRRDRYQSPGGADTGHTACRPGAIVAGRSLHLREACCTLHDASRSALCTAKQYLT